MVKVPELSSVPFLGNIHDVDSVKTHASYNRLSEMYGELFGYQVLGQHVVVVNSHDTYDAVCDEKVFQKKPIHSGLAEMRNGIGDGLFSAFAEEENWGVAHRILMPKFGPISVQQMFSGNPFALLVSPLLTRLEMYDISAQMLSKWARQGPEVEIDPTDDFTRLTLDTIALGSMNTRFNSFYREHRHPFVEAMVFFLAESGRRSFRPALVNDYLYRASNKAYQQSIETMRTTALQAIKERRDNPSDKPDLLNAMIKGKDPKTGKGMSDDNIINNAITFLIGGMTDSDA